MFPNQTAYAAGYACRYAISIGNLQFSRRGTVEAKATITPKSAPGSIFIMTLADSETR